MAAAADAAAGDDSKDSRWVEEAVFTRRCDENERPVYTSPQQSGEEPPCP
jgi:hypothetical protein